MRLTNRSIFLTTKQIRKIFRFILKFFSKEVNYYTEVHVYDDYIKYKSSITGQAFDTDELPIKIFKLGHNKYCLRKIYQGNKIHGKTLFFVVINIGVNRKYPYTNMYKVAAGKAPKYNNINEEFLHTAAHEFAHCQQFLNGETLKRHFQYEVAAERVAHKILKAYLEKQSKGYPPKNKRK